MAATPLDAEMMFGSVDWRISLKLVYQQFGMKQNGLPQIIQIQKLLTSYNRSQECQQTIWQAKAASEARKVSVQTKQRHNLEQDVSS